MPPPKLRSRSLLSVWCNLLLALQLGWLALTAKTTAAMPDAGVAQPVWGRILPMNDPPSTMLLEITRWPTHGRLELPSPFPEIVGAWLLKPGQSKAEAGASAPAESGAGVSLAATRAGQPLAWVFNAQGSRLYLEVPRQRPSRLPATVVLETAAGSGQLADGLIVFAAAEARVSGGHARLESQPGSHRIGWWTDKGDTVAWDYRPSRWGMYEVELTFAADGGAGTEVWAQLGREGPRVRAARPSTGSWYRYETLRLGRVYLAQTQPFTLEVGCQKLTGTAVINLKAVTLRPAPEGAPVVQAEEGSVRLRAHDAITHSVVMRYEPAANKNCLGYWTNPQDWAEWVFPVTRPGTFAVGLIDGCGAGQGGSTAEVVVQAYDTGTEVGRFRFVVEETGHFQILLPRSLGQLQLAPGQYTLAVRPVRKAAAAVMDVSEVELKPVRPAPDAPPAFPGTRSLWYGFERYDFEVDGQPVVVVAPKQAAPGRPWEWQAEFFGHKPNPDLALLGRGFHVVYLSIPDMLGCPAAVAHWEALYRELTGRYGFAPKVALTALSRGGLYAYNWATTHPTAVACLYGDAPVCDFKSWPGGKGKGQGSPRDWQLVLERYHFKSEAEALEYRHNPVDNLAPLAAAHVPLLHVYGEADDVVPWEENTGLVATRYRALGGDITLIAKPGVGHHPHGLDDSRPIVEFLWDHTASPAAKAWLARHGGGPLDAADRPLIRKRGTIDLDLVETTPIVFHGQPYRFEWVRAGYWNNQRHTNYFRLIDLASGVATLPFADGYQFGSAFVDGATVYVTGTAGGDHVDLFASQDLEHWERWPAIPGGRYGIFNTSLWRTPEQYVLMFEIDHPVQEAGTPFTARFATSPDLHRWTLTPPECNYAKDRYTAPHCLRWLEGWFYDFYLEAFHGYETRVVRSHDLIHWEASPLNPVLRASPEDKLIANPKLTEAQRTRIAHAVNLNNSDLDFCEYQGRLIINYSWGNQQGVEHLAEAVYDGTLAEFLRGWFPQVEP